MLNALVAIILRYSVGFVILPDLLRTAVSVSVPGFLLGGSSMRVPEAMSSGFSA